MNRHITTHIIWFGQNMTDLMDIPANVISVAYFILFLVSRLQTLPARCIRSTFKKWTWWIATIWYLMAAAGKSTVRIQLKAECGWILTDWNILESSDGACGLLEGKRMKYITCVMGTVHDDVARGREIGITWNYDELHGTTLSAGNRTMLRTH